MFLAKKSKILGRKLFAKHVEVSENENKVEKVEVVERVVKKQPVPKKKTVEVKEDTTEVSVENNQE